MEQDGVAPAGKICIEEKKPGRGKRRPKLLETTKGKLHLGVLASAMRVHLRRGDDYHFKGNKKKEKWPGKGAKSRQFQ